MGKPLTLRRKKAVPVPPAAPPPVATEAAEPEADPPKVHLPVVREPSSAVPTTATGGAETPRYPQMACTTCVIRQDCPEFDDGNVCAFETQFAKTGEATLGTVEAAMWETFRMNMERLRFARLGERTMGGGALDPQVTALAAMVNNQAISLGNFIKAREPAKTATIKAQGSAAPGLLSRLFGANPVREEIPLNPPAIEAGGQVVDNGTVTVELKQEPALVRVGDDHGNG